MIKVKDVFVAARLQDMHIAGLFLCLSIIFIPAIRVMLYPLGEGNWSSTLFYSLASLVEILFIFIFLIERRRKNYPYNHLPIILWVAFIIWAAVAIFNIPNMIERPGGTLVTAMFFIHFFFFVTLSSYLKRQPDAGQKLIISIIISSLLFMPFFWLKLQATYDQEGFDWTWSLPGFLNVRHLDYFLGSIIVIWGLLPLTIIYKNCLKTYEYIYFAILLLLWIMLFWSGARGTFLAVSVSIGMVLLFFRPDGWRRLVIFNFAAMVIGGVLSLPLPSPNGSFGLFRFLSKIDGIKDFSAGRNLIWAEAIEVWRQHLWFGIGAGQTKTVIKAATGVVSQPHNIFIQALMAWGLIGGVPFLAGIFGIFWTKGKELRHCIDQKDLIVFVTYGLAMSTSINALFDGALYSPFPVFLFVIAVSVTGMKDIRTDNQGQYQPQGRTG